MQSRAAISLDSRRMHLLWTTLASLFVVDDTHKHRLLRSALPDAAQSSACSVRQTDRRSSRLRRQLPPRFARSARRCPVLPPVAQEVSRGRFAPPRGSRPSAHIRGARPSRGDVHGNGSRRSFDHTPMERGRPGRFGAVPAPTANTPPGSDRRERNSPNSFQFLSIPSSLHPFISPSGKFLSHIHLGGYIERRRL